MLGRRVPGPRELENRNATLIGGAVNAGTSQLQQELFLRHIPSMLGRAETGIAGLYLGSASAHPGEACTVHLATTRRASHHEGGALLSTPWQCRNMNRSPWTAVGHLVGAIPGAALATVAAAVAALRRTKPLHPVGRVGHGSLVLEPTAASGVEVLDEAAVHAVLVRWSRAIGLDADKPDIEGMAVRFTIEGAEADLLFATTGGSKVGRHLLVVRSPGESAIFTTLLPVSTVSGSLLLRIHPLDAWTADPPMSWELAWSRVGGEWHPTGSLTVSWRAGDEAVRFDPVEHLFPGTRQYGVVRVMREPAYAAARLVKARPRRR